MAGLNDCYNVHDLRDAARKRLPRGVFDFFDRGTEDEVALANNRAAFERLKLKRLFCEPNAFNVAPNRARSCATRWSNPRSKPMDCSARNVGFPKRLNPRLEKVPCPNLSNSEGARKPLPT